MTALIFLGAVVLFLFGVTPYLPAKPWRIIDLPSHFMTQGVNGAVVLFVAAILFKATAALPLILAAFLLCMAQLMPYVPQHLPAAADKKTFKILQANVLKTNKDPALLQRLIEAEQPDIVACAEVTDIFAAMLEKVGDYPHRVVTAGSGEYRLALLSKLPLQKCERIAFGGARTEALLYRVEHDGKAIDAVSLHPFTPTADITARDAEFAAITARLAADKPERLMLMGDFNATPWCPAMKRILKTLKLRNARAGRGIHASWPVQLPFFMRIPIDHVLVSANLGVAGFRTGPETGSDHLPTLTTLYALND